MNHTKRPFVKSEKERWICEKEGSDIHGRADGYGVSGQHNGGRI